MPEPSLLETYERIAMSPAVWRVDDAAPDAEALAWRPATLHDAVSRPGTALRQLEQIKQFAKGRCLLDREAPANERTAYLAIYLAAIAAALRWHAVAITRLPMVHLASALVWASRQAWLPDTTRRLCDPKRLIDALSISLARGQRNNDKSNKP